MRTKGVGCEMIIPAASYFPSADVPLYASGVNVDGGGVAYRLDVHAKLFGTARWVCHSRYDQKGRRNLHGYSRPAWNELFRATSAAAARFGFLE